jgi:hypothetical protein
MGWPYVPLDAPRETFAPDRATQFHPRAGFRDGTQGYVFRYTNPENPAFRLLTAIPRQQLWEATEVEPAVVYIACREECCRGYDQSQLAA